MGFEARQLCRARGSLRSLLFSGMNIPSSLRNSPAPSPAPFPSLNIPRLSCPNPLPEFLDYPHQCREFPLRLLRWMKTHGIPRSFPMECWWDRGPICALLVLQENREWEFLHRGGTGSSERSGKGEDVVGSSSSSGYWSPELQIFLFPLGMW